MKLRCHGDRLKRASVVARMFVSSQVLPVCGYVEIEAKDGRAYLRATDMEKMVVMDLSATVEEEGKVLIPIKRLQRFAHYEKGLVVVESEDRNVWLSDTDNRVKMCIANVPADELPSVDCGEALYDVGEEFIVNLSRAWLFSAEGEEIRPVLASVLVESDGNGTVSFAAADGFRLFASSMKANLPAGVWLIPRKTCIVLAKLMRKKETVKMGFNGPKICFDGVPDVRIVSKLIEGKFPAYQSLIPSQPPEWTFTVSGPVLQSRAMQFENNIARLTKTKDGFLRMGIGDNEEDSFWSKIPAKMTGDGKIALNPVYLADLSGMFAELTMEVTHASSPVKVYGDLEGVTVVVMPMFVQWE